MPVLTSPLRIDTRPKKRFHVEQLLQRRTKHPFPPAGYGDLYTADTENSFAGLDDRACFLFHPVRLAGCFSAGAQPGQYAFQQAEQNHQRGIEF